MTNTDALKGFIDLALEIPDFNGEIIIAENHQSQVDDSRGWTTEFRNGRYNLNELVQYYQKKGYYNVTKYHWHNGGQCTFPLVGDACCGKLVKGPHQGDGYVWTNNCYYTSPNGRRCVMSYPVFTSKYSGITIDLKNGAWKNGVYLDRSVKLINFSALNYHSRYVGATASVKNLMGIVDMTCGYPGNSPEGTYNVHHIGVSKKIALLNKYPLILSNKGQFTYKFKDYCNRNFHYTGGALGFFMKNIRFPDLNIIAADLVGWGDRKDPSKAFRPRALLMSKDPVALDYVAVKHILYPGTPENALEESGIYYRDLINPDNMNGSFMRFLQQAHKQGVGNIVPEKIEVIRV
jgi:hypothetical protein